MKDVTIGNVYFKVIEKLGKGSYGNVYRVLLDDKEYALKVIKNPANPNFKTFINKQILPYENQLKKNTFFFS